MGICVWQASLRSYWLTQLVCLVLASIWSSSGVNGSCPQETTFADSGTRGMKTAHAWTHEWAGAGVQVEGFTVWEFWLRLGGACLVLGSINRNWYGLAWAEETALVSASPSYTEDQQHGAIYNLYGVCSQATSLWDRGAPGCCSTNQSPLGPPVLHSPPGPQLSLIF